MHFWFDWIINPLECRDIYIATLNDMKLVCWPLMGGLSHKLTLTEAVNMAQMQQLWRLLVIHS